MAKLTEKEAKDLWVKFACAALSGYSPQGEFEDENELADDMSAVASRCADTMLDEYEGLFASASKRRKKVKRVEEEPEEEDDPDLDEDDE